MDLQAGHIMGNRRQTMTTLATLFCFALACALMIGSLMAAHKAERTGQSGTPLTWNSATRIS